MLTHLLQTFHGLTTAQPRVFGLQQEGDVTQLPPWSRLLFAVPVQVGPRQALQLLQTVSGHLSSAAVALQEARAGKPDPEA